MHPLDQLHLLRLLDQQDLSNQLNLADQLHPLDQQHPLLPLDQQDQSNQLNLADLADQLPQLDHFQNITHKEHLVILSFHLLYN